MGWDDLGDRGGWPSIEQVKDFRTKTINIALDVLKTIDLSIAWNSDCWAFLMAL